MTDVAAMSVSDIELNDVPDMRQKDQEPLVAPGPCYATHLDVSAAQTRARDTVDAVTRGARAAAARHGASGWAPRSRVAGTASTVPRGMRCHGG